MVGVEEGQMVGRGGGREKRWGGRVGVGCGRWWERERGCPSLGGWWVVGREYPLKVSSNGRRQDHLDPHHW